MKTLRLCLFLIILSIANLKAHVIHQKAPIKQEWKEENIDPFDELILSWNACRPEKGKFLFYVSVKTDKWSPWLLYAYWGSDGQSSFRNTAENAPVKVYQDILKVTQGKKATAFRIKIVTEGDSNLEKIYGLHVYTNSHQSKKWQKTDVDLDSIYLNVPGLSQMALNHARHSSLCSPTSTTAVTRYLSNNYEIDPLDLAEQAWDSGFDIFGNWVFNIAQASTYLGDQWDSWVEKLSGFHDIYSYLQQKTPVIVSVRGPLTGSAQPYAQGHLLVVIGYDSLNRKVLCMDPAFPADDETYVSYPLSEFVQAWSRRENIAYVFKKKI